MANVIKCPVCGESNLADQEFCQYCQARLHPLTGDLKGEDATLKPGQAPTKKNTGELEPVLPQWLREARSSARQTSEEGSIQAAQPPQDSRPSFSGADLLAGLQSQSQDNDEEDTPDWLADITGETPKTKKSEPDSSEVRWVELGETNDFAQSEPASDAPSWLKGLSSPTPQPDEKDELTSWMRDAGDSQKPQPFSFDTPPSVPVANEPPSADETPDWLRSMVTDDGAFNDSENTSDEPLISSDTPDWLRAMDEGSSTQNAKLSVGNLGKPSVSSDDTPDWLRAMDAENAAQSANIPPSNSDKPSVSSDDTPDWLRAMDAENAAQNTNIPPSNSGKPSVSSEDAPDWLRAMDTEDKSQSAGSVGFSNTGSGESGAAPSAAGDAPDWLKGFESDTSTSDLDWLKGIQSGESQQPVQDSAPAWLNTDASAPVEKNETPALTPQQPSAAPEKDDPELDIPSWLKAAAPQSSIFDEPVVQHEAPAPVSSSSDTPDWLNAFKSVEPPEAQATSAFSTETPVDSTPPATSKGGDQPRANTDALFTEMPDWLSIVDDTAAPESIPAPITNVDAIAPGDLPSWVQAMRPVDTGVPQVSSTLLSGDKTLESRGALSGLQGVLPAVPGFSPTSKPKAYSIKMKASEEQLAHAALLEQILAAETAPVPIGSFSALGTSRGLRWLLALLFFVVLSTALFMQTQIFSMPVGLPSEVDSALKIVKAVPEGAPVLVAFDYEPARVGEMEAAAAPMFDQMNNLRLTFISINETGAILAERFISGNLAEKYQNGVNYLNLGYLPGGQMGIRSFVQDPLGTARFAITGSPVLFDISLTPAWTSDPWNSMTSLSQFAAFIIVTDNADFARAWIEQTTSAPAPIPSIPFVVISSAQAAPMIQPYYASQQINGLVSGLYGGALAEQQKDAEQKNAEGPGIARTYWDAYSIGMLLAVVFILGGGLLNLILGSRDRAAAGEAK